MRTHAIFAAVIWAILALPSLADIDCNDTYQDHEPIVVTVSVTGVPDGAKLRGSFAVSGAEYVQAGEQVFHVWAAPGEHLLTATGVWVLTDDIEINGKTISALVDFGQYTYSKAITVGEVPDPVPPPVPPVPVEQLGVVIVEDAESRTTLPYGQVQAMTLPDIRELATWFRLVDKDVTDIDGNVPANLRSCLQLAAKETYPHMIVHDQAGKVLWNGPVPVTAGEMRTLLSKYRPKVAPTPAAAKVQSAKYVRRTYCEDGRCTTVLEIAP